MPVAPRALIDLGCGDGRLAGLVLGARPSLTSVVGLDISASMLQLAAERFAQEPKVTLRAGDLNEQLTAVGACDVVVSGFAIHHVTHRAQAHPVQRDRVRADPGRCVRQPRGRLVSYP
jgi:tRNA (cmo5U34)-methyltransferase